MSATEFSYDERDLKFQLNEKLNIATLTAFAPYKDFSVEDFDMIVSEAVKFATDVVAPTNRTGDLEGTQLVDGQVHVPKCFIGLQKAFGEAGWLAASGKPEFGGQGLPKVMVTALADIFTGANTSFILYGYLGIGVAHILEKYTSGWMQDIVLPKLYDGTWTGTMLLTEPQAGSDVGMAKTRAEKVEGTDYYHLTGTKMFITGGDQDMTENIMHLTLARTPDAPAGVKGLSLFLVPKMRIDEKGKCLGRNDVTPIAIEHKLGIKGSATTQLSLGEAGECRGWLVGKEQEGIKIMFNMMNEARIEVGIQGSSLTNAAYQSALAYARDRIQGSAIENFKDPNAQRVPIIEHPDLRRQLLTIKAYGEGLRSLLLYASYCEDMAENAATPEEREQYHGFLELLTPVCKAYSTDRGVDMTSMAIQVLGGYGYTQDYPIEQYLRDVKIGCLYEGTNSIQALDLLARKMPMKAGMVLFSFMGELDKITAGLKDVPELAELAEVYAGAKNRVLEAAMTLGGWAMQKELAKATSRASLFLDLFGDVILAGELLKGALVAQKALSERLARSGVDAADRKALAAHLAESPESAFYHSKIAVARFFTQWILPRTEGTLKCILNPDVSHMEIVF